MKHSLNSRHPSDHTSTFSLISLPWYRSTISGARYASVVFFEISSSMRFRSWRSRGERQSTISVVHEPKSHSLNTWCSSSCSRFSTFRSRCATGGFRAWRCATALQQSRKISATSRLLSRFRACRRASMSSKTLPPPHHSIRIR